MRNRVILLSLGFLTLGGAATAAVPDQGTPPSDKPPLYHASPMINDPVTPTRVRGQAPVTDVTTPLVAPGVQANVPSDKPSLYHAAPAIMDPNTTIRGKKPDGSHIIGTPNAKPDDPTEDYLQAQIPDPSKPPLYRASPMIDDRVRGKTIRGKAPASTAPLIHATPPTSGSN